ncbi:MAG: glycerol-3-phosphate acyltransferase [Eubacteriales bacterium]|jgi:glycerol-3-phosphate acyltransferase PlsY
MAYIAICLTAGYFCGCVLSAVIVSRFLYHKDIFSLGTGNPGMANTMAQIGFKAGLLVLAGDLAKTVIPCFILRLVYGKAAAAAWTGLGAMLGHSYPFWHKFRGGKGVACFCAAVFCVFPFRGLLAMIGGLLTVLLTKYLPVGSVVIPTLFAFIVYLTDGSPELMVPVILLAVCTWIRHIPEFIRIARHTEPHFDLIAVIRKATGEKNHE